MLTHGIHATRTIILPILTSITMHQNFMLEQISLITGVNIGEISTARLYDLLFEIV